jgi:hypothetical protein
MSTNVDLTKANSLLDHLKTILQSKGTVNITAANHTLTQLKIELTRFPLSSTFQDAKASIPQLLVARTAYEYASLLALSTRDLTTFERQFAQLKPYYTDFADILPVSDRAALLFGLHLFTLMATNQIAEFHTELEFIGHHARPLLSTPPVKFAIRTEQQMMEGNYAAVMNCRSSMPNDEFSVVVETLLETVLQKKDECAKVAYTNSSQFDENTEPASIASVASLIRTLEYAHELERIV